MSCILVVAPKRARKILRPSSTTEISLQKRNLRRGNCLSRNKDRHGRGDTWYERNGQSKHNAEQPHPNEQDSYSRRKMWRNVNNSKIQIVSLFIRFLHSIQSSIILRHEIGRASCRERV